MNMYKTTRPINKYLNVKLRCGCGKTHYAPVKVCDIAEGALERLPEYVGRYGYKKPYLLCDSITYRIAGEKCETLLREAGYDPAVRVLTHLNFDEATLGEILIHKPLDADLMIGVGTGNISGILRYAAYQLDLPCYIVPTAVPMDGFTTPSGIINVDGLKRTFDTNCAEVIVADTAILAGAPARMAVAGYGDLITKLSSLTDWRLGALINGDHFCAAMETMITDYVRAAMEKTEGLKTKEPDALTAVTNGLMLTGAVTTLYGNSRPISGGEHHMSHMWEALGEERPELRKYMHGEQAAVGTVMMLMLAEELKKETVDFDAAREDAKRYDPAAWEAEIRRAYGGAAEAVIELERKKQKNAAEGRLARIDRIEEKWPEVKAILDRTYPADDLIAKLRLLGGPAYPSDIGVDEATLRGTCLYSKDTRAVYTLSRLVWDLGLTGKLAERVIARLRERNAL